MYQCKYLSVAWCLGVKGKIDLYPHCQSTHPSNKKRIAQSMTIFRGINHGEIRRSFKGHCTHCTAKFNLGSMSTSLVCKWPVLIKTLKIGPVDRLRGAGSGYNVILQGNRDTLRLFKVLVFTNKCSNCYYRSLVTLLALVLRALSSSLALKSHETWEVLQEEKVRVQSLESTKRSCWQYLLT